MEIGTISYVEGSGWSGPFPSHLDSERTFVLAFGAPRLGSRRELFAELRKAFPRSRIIGCSSAGEIHGRKVFDGSLSVAVTKLAHAKVDSISMALAPEDDAEKVGYEIGAHFNRPGLAGVLVLSEGLKINGSALAKGITDGVPPGVPVTGGLAGDGSDFKETWVLAGDAVLRSHVAAVAFYGPRIRISHASQGGWDIFGPDRIVTRSERNRLYELDGKPALQLYKEYLGEKSSDLPASGLLFPLQIRESRDAKRSLVRTILSVDEKEQCLVFAGDVPQGWQAQLMRANFDRLIDGASAAAGGIPMGDHRGPTLLVAISCVGRRLVLGERIEEEVEATLSRMSSSVVQVGFYSYGELSPFSKGDPCELHNQTMTLTALSEG